MASWSIASDKAFFSMASWSIASDKALFFYGFSDMAFFLWPLGP